MIHPSFSTKHDQCDPALPRFPDVAETAPLGAGKRAGETPALRKLLEEFCGVEEDCDGTIVHEVDGHVRLEDACLDAGA